MRRMVGGLLALVAVAAGIAIFGAATARAVQPDPFGELQERLLSGEAYTALHDSSGQTSAPTNYNPRGSGDCAATVSSNVKVNQNCVNVSDPDLQGRGQSQNETAIAIDPMNQNHVIATYNDYRRGDGTCGASWSLDNGRTWNDSTVPNNFTRGTQFNAPREYWQGGGDTSIAFDTKGNAYLSCQLFNRGGGTSPNLDLSSAFYVYRSTGNYGASWTFPGRPVQESADVLGTGGPPFLDKQYLTVDNRVGSPFQDRIYVTWTEFTSTGTAYIWEAYSNDYGEHFSPRHLVSAGDPTLCSNSYGLPTPEGTCNENQFSQPFTGPDGALYVVYANFNTPLKTAQDNRNQILMAKSMDGGNTFVGPVKVTDYYDLPDCATYQNGQDAGRACVPEKGPTNREIFRATNYPSGMVDPTNPAHVVVTVGSFINRHSNEANGCVPAGINPATGYNLYTGVKTPGACNNDILVSESNNGGAAFTGTLSDPRILPTANTEPGQATTSQFWQWFAFTKSGKMATSYYDRQYGADEATGTMDISLSSSGSGADWTVTRVTKSSMPPPTQFGGLFFGDYSGLAADTKAFPLWMDTRSPDLFLCPGTGSAGSPPQTCTGVEPAPQGGLLANDQDIFVDSVGVSNSG
jgi:hypothetical protein